jgi:hypothetical protein
MKKIKFEIYFRKSRFSGNIIVYLHSMKKMIIKTVSKGPRKGQFRFLLKGANGEVIAQGETYTVKHNIVSLHKDHFPDFELVDKSKNVENDQTV